MGGAVLKSWSKSQASVALSRGEAEYYSMTKGAAEAFGLQSVVGDLGWPISVRLWVDSAAAKSNSSRKGIGKVRHMAVRELWLQGKVREGELEISKIPGAQNIADALTKALGGGDIQRLLRLAHMEVQTKVSRGEI